MADGRRIQQGVPRAGKSAEGGVCVLVGEADGYCSVRLPFVFLRRSLASLHQDKTLCTRQAKGSRSGSSWKAGARAVRNIKLIEQIANSSHNRSVLPFARQAERCVIAILQGG